MKNKKRIFGVAIIVVLIAIQFIPVEKPVESNNNDYYTENLDNPSAELVSILDKACKDCHSNNTTYPWYYNIAPISWKINGHINEGLNHLNFSEWNTISEEDKAYQKKEIVEVVTEKRMPLTPYWLIHWEAKLTDEEREIVANYFRD